MKKVCLCGCGKPTRKNSIVLKGHLQVYIDGLPMVPCACGHCNELIKPVDQRGRPRLIVHGHNAYGWQPSLNIIAAGHTPTVEAKRIATRKRNGAKPSTETIAKSHTTEANAKRRTTALEREHKPSPECHIAARTPEAMARQKKAMQGFFPAAAIIASHTPEANAHRKETLKGRAPSENTLAALRNPETKAKRRATLKGRIPTEQERENRMRGIVQYYHQSSVMLIALGEEIFGNVDIKILSDT